MCPLNMSDFPPPAPSQTPTTFGRPASTSCHCTCSPMSSSSFWTRSPIRCSSPVGLAIETRSTARRTRRSASISTEMRQPLLPEQLDLLVPPLAPELEHHVRAARLAVLLDRGDAIRGRAGNRPALVEDLVRHLCLRGEPAALLHRLGNREDLVLGQPCEVEQRFGGAFDVLHLVGEVHACNLACTVSAGVSVRLVDGRDDRAADVDVRT